jgi:antirestriction protein ArdC
MAATHDVHAEVTNRILAQLELGVRPWMQPWSTGGAGVIRPRRFTGEAYRGINTLILWGAAELAGYTAPTWLTFKQALDAGGAVRKGERGSTVVYASTFNATAEDHATGDTVETAIPFLKAYTVFNVQQCDGLPEHLTAVPAPTPEPERIAAAEAFITATNALVVPNGLRAYYCVSNDTIRMPPRAAFASAHDWYCTVLHELVHWTGPKNRCNRIFGERFGDSTYAREELVAELGSAFLCADLGIDAAPCEDHAAYLADWLEVLKNDKRAVFQAASLASRAVDFLDGLQVPAEAAAQAA